MDRITGPLFKWFGSKWSAAKHLPVPKFHTVVEPFAGSAGYSLRHHTRDVCLYEADPHLAYLWKWLIEKATPAKIRAIPIGIPEGTDIRTLGLSRGQATLLKTWQRTNNVGDCWTISPWGNKPGQWTANTRARVAEEHCLISHWLFCGGEGLEALQPGKLSATYYIDPPYQYNYQYRTKSVLNYESLGNLCKKVRGQVIVAEARDPKTGNAPCWLPFTDFRSTVTSRRKAHQSHHSKELLWHNLG